MEKLDLEKHVNEGLSIRNIGKKTGKSSSCIRYYLMKYNLRTKWVYPTPFNVDELKILSIKHKSISEILRTLGLKVSNTTFLSIKRFAKTNNILLPKNGNKGGNKKFPKRSDDEIFCIDSKVSRSVVRKRLIKEGKGLICELCEQGVDWKGHKLSMVLDHKNGIPDDNRRENLRFICPNCDSTLDTFCGRNIKKNK